MNIPVAKPFLGIEEEEAAAAAIRSGWVSQGPRVREFEEQFAEYVGAGYAIATTSCTTALHAALVVSGIGPGDEVVVPSLSFIATANAVVHTGAKPIFADIDPETCNVTAETIRKVITPRTKAIMPVHQMGLPVDLDPIMNLCRERDLVLVEDAACAIGSEYKSRRIGGHGNIACFSFHPRKVMTTGEGGMITTNDPDIAGRLRRFRHHGMTVSDRDRHISRKVIFEEYAEIGYNYRMTDIQAGIGIEQLRKLPLIVKKRREIADIYNGELGCVCCLSVPKIPGYAFHNYQSYWIGLCDSAPVSRDNLMQRLLDRGIATRKGIMAIHKEDCYKDYGITIAESERISKTTLILPLYPTLTHEEQRYVVDCIREVLR